MAKEIELKLTAPPRALSMAARQPWLRELTTGKSHTEKLESVYFDTPKNELYRRQVSLRIRRIGPKRLQTIKSADNPSTRDEWEQEIDRDVPDTSLAKNTAAESILKRRTMLQPVFETAVERTSLPLRYGESEIELAIDRGWIRAGRKRERIGEFELELKQGDPADLAKMAKKIAETVPVSYGALAKAERGYALSSDTRGAPAKGSHINLTSAQSCAKAFGAIAHSCLHHFAANERAVRKRDPEGVHQMRVGLRRLRAAMSVFKEMLASSETENIKAELKWLTARLSPARDFDVLVREEIDPLRDAKPDAREIGALASDIESRRDEGFAQAKAAVASERYRGLALRTALWIAAGEWLQSTDAFARGRREAPVLAFARESLKERTKKIVKKSRKLEKLDARKRHKLRIAVKKLRYAAEFFAGLFDKRKETKARRRFEAIVKSLQHALGKLNDITVHEKFAHELASAKVRVAKQPQEAYAMGYLTGREQKKLRDCLAAAADAAGKLADAKPFW